MQRTVRSSVRPPTGSRFGTVVSGRDGEHHVLEGREVPVERVIGDGDEQRAKDVAAYERAHKNRSGVLRGAERETANA